MLIKFDKYLPLSNTSTVDIIAEVTSVELNNVATFLEEAFYGDVHISITAPNRAHPEEVLWMYFHRDSKEVEMSKNFFDIEEELGGEVLAGVYNILEALDKPTII